MEVHFAPQMEKQLNELALQGGRGSAAELVQVVMEDYFEEVSRTGQMLDNRYEELKSGRVQPVPGEVVMERLRAKSERFRLSGNAAL